MANYAPYYPGGWKNLPDRTTPERAEALQNIEQRLMDIDTGALSNTYALVAEPVSVAETARATAAEALKLAKASNLSDVASPSTALANLSGVAKNTLTYNVKDYGALGDGTTDDTTAVQSAITAAKTNGAEVLIPSGTYLVSNLTLDYGADTAQGASGPPYGYRAPTIRGVGNRVPILQQKTGSTGAILTVQGKTGSNAGPGHNNKVTGFVLRDLEIIGTSGGGHGLALRSLVGCAFTNLLIRGCGGSGVYIARETFVSGVNDEYAYDLTFTNVKCMVNTRWGFECSGTNSISATLVGCDASSNTLGGYLVAPTNWSMFGCVAIGNSAGTNTGYGLQSVRNSNTASTNNTLLLSGCRFEGNSASGGYDVKIDGGYGYQLQDCTFFSTAGAHSVGIGTNASGSSSFVQSPMISGGYFGGDGTTTTAKAIVTGSDCRNLLVINPRFDYATYGTGGNTTPNSLITDNGATTSVWHSQNLLPNAAGYFDWARKISAPGVSAAGMARMYIRDSNNLAGKTQFALRFPSGAEQIFASEPENGSDPKRITYSTAAPTGGTWAIGDFCYSATPDVNGLLGWVCAVAGTPGTWIPVPIVASGNDLGSGQECLPRDLAVSSVAMTSGVLRIRYFTARKTETENNIYMRTGTTGAGATPTLCRMGIYSVATNGDLTLIGSCANDTTLFATASTKYTRALTSSVSLVAGQRYAIAAIVVTAAAAPTILSSSTGGDANELATTPRQTAILTAQTDLTTPITAGSLAATSTSIFGVVTP